MDRPLRILHISTRLILGGSQENTVLSCQGQAALGHEVHLAFGPIYGPEGSLLEQVQRFTTDDGRRIGLHTVPHLVRELSPVADTRCWFELVRLIEQVKPDIVHTHSSKAGILGRSAAWHAWKRARSGRHGQWPGPAVVHTIHGPPFHAYERAWRNTVYVLAERYAARRCHLIVSVADAMSGQFLERRIGAPAMYRTVRSGMELQPYIEIAERPALAAAARARYGIPAGAFVAGTIARLAEHKGHDDLLDALPPLLRERDRLHLFWVGDGWLRERLEARIAALGLQGRVTLAGLVPPQDVPGTLAAMDVLIHPSYREGLPRTVVQAMLAGRPVIAYDCDGTPEVVVDRETGRLVRVGDAPGLAESLRWMMDHPDNAAAMARTALQRCRTAFSAETMVDELERVYAEALRRARSVEREASAP
jgi:glycosyltransferase involved in cell wall biosynthesis